MALEIASESFECPSPSSYDFHAYSPLVCSYCSSFDHDVNSYPYFDVLDECYARLDAMIGTMNEQHERFVSRMRECGLLHEIDFSLPFPRLKAHLCDDCESFLPLESDVNDDVALTDLGKGFDPPLTPLTFVAPSFFSTPMDTSVSDSILLASPLPVARCTGLEMGETSWGEAN